MTENAELTPGFYAWYLHPGTDEAPPPSSPHEGTTMRQLGGIVWRNSVARSRKDVVMLTLIHAFASGDVQTWWGPMLRVEQGSTVHYFHGPDGIAVEWVESPVEKAL